MGSLLGGATSMVDMCIRRRGIDIGFVSEEIGQIVTKLIVGAGGLRYY